MGSAINVVAGATECQTLHHGEIYPHPLVVFLILARRE